MVIIMPDKSFCKKAKKLVQTKDFFIADATEDYDGPVSEFGNRTFAVDFVPTPTLKKIASDPDSKEAKIKMRSLPRHLETWMNDENFMMWLYYFVDILCKNWDNTREDMNIFLVFRKHEYALVAKPVRDFINQTYGVELAHLLTHKMPKEELKRIINLPVDESFMGRLKKRTKQIKKSFDPKKLRDALGYEYGLNE